MGCREILAAKGTVRTYTDVNEEKRRLTSEGMDAWLLEDGSLVHISHIQRKRFKPYAGKLRFVGWMKWNPWEGPLDIQETKPIGTILSSANTLRG